MMPGNVFRLQMTEAFSGRRRMALRVWVSGLLALPFILVAMPARAQAAGIVMVIVFTAFFGAAVSHARLRADLRLSRLQLLPTSRATLWLDLVLASMLARVVPAVVVLCGFVAVNGRVVTAVSLIRLAGWLCASLLLLTALGSVIARLARNNAEVHLFGALTCAVIAFVSGVTPLPDRLKWLTAAGRGNPIWLLRSSLTGLTTEASHVRREELVFSLLVIALIAGTAVLRWVSGGAARAKQFDAA